MTQKKRDDAVDWAVFRRKGQERLGYVVARTWAQAQTLAMSTFQVERDEIDVVLDLRGGR